MDGRSLDRVFVCLFSFLLVVRCDKAACQSLLSEISNLAKPAESAEVKEDPSDLDIDLQRLAPEERSEMQTLLGSDDVGQATRDSDLDYPKTLHQAMLLVEFY